MCVCGSAEGVQGDRGRGGGVACAQATRAGSAAVQSAESFEKPSERKPCSPVDPMSLRHQAPAGPRGRRADHQPLSAQDRSTEQLGKTWSASACASAAVAGSLRSGSPELRGGVGPVGGLELSRKQGAGEATR